MAGSSSSELRPVVGVLRGAQVTWAPTAAAKMDPGVGPLRGPIHRVVGERTGTWLAVGGPILGLILAILGFAFILLTDIARERDENFATISKAQIETSLQAELAELQAVASDYAVWDDANARVTVKRDTAWMAKNFTSPSATSISIYRVGAGVTYAHSHDPELPAAALSGVIGETFDFERLLARTAVAIEAPAVAFVKVDGKIFVVAASPLRSQAEHDRIRRVYGAPVDFVILARPLKIDRLVSSSASIGVGDVRVRAAAPTRGEIGVQLKHRGGDPTWLVWRDPRPGTALIQQRLGWIAAALALIGLLAFLLAHSQVGRHMRASAAAQAAAEAANRTKSQFLATMSHELRTPLNAVIGYAELLQETAAEDERAQDVFDAGRIRHSGAHLLALINDLLDHAKIEAGEMHLHCGPIDTVALIDEVADMIRPRIVDSGNLLMLDIAPGLAPVMADRLRLKQCLLNLAGNAAKFTKGGAVTLSVYHDGDFIAFAVRDTGIGMTKDTIARLFRPYVQADPTIVARFGGAGLGLAITRMLITGMGGDVRVESVLNEGSVFTLRAPVAQADELAAAA